MKGNIYYVDFERLKKHNGFIYYWSLIDLLKPDKWGDVSYIFYHQGDCTLFRQMELTSSGHNQPMGAGTISSATHKNPKWTYPLPNSVAETKLKSVCSR